MSKWLEMFTIYRNPRDFELPPSETQVFVVRRSEVVPPGQIRMDKEPLSISYTLEAARHSIEVVRPGLALFPRSPDEDPVIVEVWL